MQAYKDLTYSGYQDSLSAQLEFAQVRKGHSSGGHERPTSHFPQIHDEARRGADDALASRNRQTGELFYFCTSASASLVLADNSDVETVEASTEQVNCYKCVRCG